MARRRTGRVTETRVLLVAAFGAFLAFLDATIVNVAFPSIRESFPGTSIGELSWVLNAYNIVFAAFLIVFGRLADLLGRRRDLHRRGRCCSPCASALCGAAPTLGLLVAARVLQALGAAMLVPASLALVVEAFPEERRAHAIGLWGATAAVAAGLGPPIGGALVELGGWRWAFFVNIPFGLAAVLVARSKLVESRAPGRRRMPDLRGAAPARGRAGGAQRGHRQGQRLGLDQRGPGRVRSRPSCCGVLFALSSRGHRSPLLDPTLLRIPSFAWPTWPRRSAGLGFYAYLLTNILWLQYVWGYSVLRAGLALVPGALVAAVVAAAARPGGRAARLPLGRGAGRRWCGPVRTSGTTSGSGLEPAFLERVVAGPGAQRHRRRRHPAGARQRGAGRGPRRPLRDGVRCGVQRPPARRGPRHRPAGRHHRQPRAGDGGGRLPRRLGAVDLAFLVVAVLSIPLGRLGHAVDRDRRATTPGRPRVHPPHPPRRCPSRPRAGAGSTGLAGRTAASLRFGGLPAHRLDGRHTAGPAGGRLVDAGGRSAGAGRTSYGAAGWRSAIAGTVVRELGPGAVIGELALLTGELRSAAIRARRDSTVLEIPRDEFDDAPRRRPGRARGPSSRSSPSGCAPPGRRPDGARATPAGRGRRRDAPPRAPAAGRAPPASSGLLRTTCGRRPRRRRRGGARAGRARPRPGRARRRRPATAPTWRGGPLPAPGRRGRPGRATRMRRRRCRCAPVTAARQPGRGAGRGRGPTGRGPGWTADRRLAGDRGRAGDSAAGLRPLVDRLAGRSLGLALAGGGARAFAHVGVLRELEEAGHPRRPGGRVQHRRHHGGGLRGRAVTGEELEAICYDEFVRRRPFSD